MQNELIQTKDDILRQINEIAVKAGKARQCLQTGYIHHYYGDNDNNANTIPLYENCLYALALFRTKTVENITEAKSLLEKILWFQSPLEESKGNFPVYLHEFPVCRDWWASIQLLPPIYWMLAQFNTVLGNSLLKKVESSARQILDYAMLTSQDKKPSYNIGVKIASSLIAFGVFFNDKRYEKSGHELMSRYLHNHDVNSWCSPVICSDLLSSFQMIYPALSTSPWKDLWTFFSRTWHPQTLSYIGPSFREYQDYFEPQPSLYDLYLGYFNGCFSQRTLKDNVFHLHGVLVQPSQDCLYAIENYPFITQNLPENAPWKVTIKKNYAWSVIPKSEPINPSHEKGYHSFRLIWGSLKRLHSLVLQGGNIRQLDYQETDNGIDLILNLDEIIPGEDRDKQREVAFYLDLQPRTSLRVESIPANTFKIGEVISFTLDGLSCELTFDFLEGEGSFMGHMMLGNRLAQIAAKGIHKYEAYDWQIYLRTLQRTDPCKIKASLRIKTIE